MSASNHRNKLPVLCKYAAERPDVVTTLIDANSEYDMLAWANKTGARELHHGKLGVRFYQQEKLTRWPCWFGREECNQDLVVWAKYLAVRGADCPELMQAYDEVLDATRDRDPDVGCQCFDEEYLLSQLYAKPLFRKEVPDRGPEASPRPRPSFLARHATDLLILTSAAFLFPAHHAGRKGLTWIRVWDEEGERDEADEVDFSDSHNIAQICQGVAFILLAMWLIFANNSKVGIDFVDSAWVRCLSIGWQSCKL
ncbi:hypothetical protein AK812_SmicGene8132 [Symbiodinium microadriaticum]|uniref:Uncharacterized protein n=1 Tax=Symbiodinium microadriaticum TaxID=2951 RepID=A0A1Q9ELS7_SYMMI|nr:hypothetical protein AK812_SmicGene8132 [Symbiodinium microadriaticum]